MPRQVPHAERSGGTTTSTIQVRSSKLGKHVPSDDAGLSRVGGSVWERSASDHGRVASGVRRQAYEAQQRQAAAAGRRAAAAASPVVEAERNARLVRLDRDTQQVSTQRRTTLKACTRA
jgi:hypothetical protein